MKRSIKYLSMAVFALAANAWAGSAEEELLNAFVKCDASMFDILKNKQEQLSKYAPIEKVGKTARFQLGSADEDGKRQVIFNKPIIVNGIHFSSFSAEYSELPVNETGKNPVFYFWGFELKKARAADVVAKFPQWGLKPMGKNFATPSQIIINSHQSVRWQPNMQATTGSIPAKNTVEKLLILEESNGKTSLYCTIQGYPNDKLIRRERLDLIGGK